MKILLIILKVLGYIVIGAIVTVIAYKFFDQDREEAIAIGIGWPILGTLGLIFYISGTIAMLLCEGGEMLWEWVEKKIK